MQVHVVRSNHVSFRLQEIAYMHTQPPLLINDNYTQQGLTATRLDKQRQIFPLVIVGDQYILPLCQTVFVNASSAPMSGSQPDAKLVAFLFRVSFIQ